jgi:hypothetical protein
LEAWSYCLRTLGWLLILRADGCHCFPSFIKHTTVIARRILKYARMSSRTVLHVEMYFTDCKNETKIKRRFLIWRLVIWMNRSKFSSFYYLWYLSYLSISAMLFSKHKIEVPHGENLKKVVSSLKSVKLCFDKFSLWNYQI